MACGNYVCGSNENLKLCFQCDLLFCPDCGPPDVEFDDNIDPEEIYCGGCVPNKCDKCGDKSYEYSTELCPQLGDGYYCSECIEEEDDECYECGAYESVKQCSECDKIFCPAHGPHYEYLNEPDVIYCVSCLESLKKRGLLSVGHECGTVICPDCKKDPDANNYYESCMCGLEEEEEEQA